MDDGTIQKMKPATKKWFAKAIVGMIVADGRIDKAEMEYLKSMIGYLDERDLEGLLLESIRKKEVPKLEPMDIIPNEALEIIKHLTVVAVVDEDLADNEVTFLKYVAAQLGLSDKIAERFLSLAKEKLNRIRFNARVSARSFSEQVRCFDLTENSCMFYSNHNVRANSCIDLQFFKQKIKEDESNLYQAITAESAWSRAVTSKHGHYVVNVLFQSSLEEDQGYELLKLIESAENGS
jgi:hypothetical protein